MVTSAVFVLVASGQLFSWVISYAQIPQLLTDAVLGTDPSALRILVTVTIFFFIGCMFVDSLVVIIIPVSYTHLDVYKRLFPAFVQQRGRTEGSDA